MDGSTRHVRQAAAIAIRAGRICLVTSRNGKRWVVPKGCLEPGKSIGETALQEAWEEAGVVGDLDENPLGYYFYEKAGSRYRVTVFLMRVAHVRSDWPERGWRMRRWLSPERALSQVDEFGLRKLIRQVSVSKDAALSH
jgi:8-oxo-dGTP pyrophosphatase MutT (NUDIX family)